MDASRSVVGADLSRGTDSPVPCGGEDGEETAVPSFKNAFSEALLSASQSVMAASRGMVVYCKIPWKHSVVCAWLDTNCLRNLATIVHVGVWCLNSTLYKILDTWPSKFMVICNSFKGWFTIWCWCRRSVASVRMMPEQTWFLFQHCVACVSQRPTNQIVKKFDIRNRI